MNILFLTYLFLLNPMLPPSYRLTVPLPFGVGRVVCGDPRTGGASLKHQTWKLNVFSAGLQSIRVWLHMTRRLRMVATGSRPSVS